MNLAFRAEKISGATDGKYFSGVFAKHITFGDGGVGLFAFCALAKVESAVAGTNVASVLHEAFVRDSKKIESRQEDILTELVALRATGVSRFEQMGLTSDFVIVVFYRDAVYVARHGDKVLVNIFRPPKSFEVKFSEGSGIVRGGDLVLVSTAKFVETFNSDVFASDRNLVFADAIDGLATDISVLEAQSEVGAIFVQVKGAGGETIVQTDNEPETSTAEVQAEPAGEKKISFFGKIAPAVLGEFRHLRTSDIKAIFRLRRNLVFVAVILILVLVGSGYMSLRGELDGKKKAQLDGYMTSANSKYNEAVGIVDLNQERARELLVEAGRSVDLALSVTPSDANALGLKRQIEEKLAQTANLSTVSFSTFYDGGDKVGAISRGTDSFFVFGDGGIAEVDDVGKEIDKLSEVSVTSGFVYDNNVFSVVGGKVSKISNTGKVQVIAAVSGLGDMAVFLGNVYVLGGDQIYKYVPIADGYAKSAPYLEQTKSFGSESRMTIDGSIWVTAGSGIFKYTRGANEAFEISGVNGVGTLGEIYTNVDIDNLYVVDRSNSALLVISKEGVVSKTYNSGEFAKATDLFVDEESGKMYIGSGTKVLVADL